LRLVVPKRKLQGVENLWETCGQTVPCPKTDSSVSAMMLVQSAVSNYADRANDIVRAVHLLRRHGMAVGFPMQTADGDIIFSVGKHTLTADQILELLGRAELHAEGVR